MQFASSQETRTRNYKKCTYPHLIHLDERRISGNTAIVVLSRHEDVAGISPVSRPRVLHNPVVLAVERAKTNGKHSVIKLVIEVTALWLVVHPMAVETERHVRRVNVDRHRLLQQCKLQGSAIERLRLHIACDLGSNGGIGKVALAILHEIRAIALGRGNAAMCHDPLVCTELLTAIAGIVALAPCAVHHILLAEFNELLGVQEESAFDHAGGAERPARAADSLVLDRGHSSINAPVMRRRNGLHGVLRDKFLGVRRAGTFGGALQSEHGRLVFSL